MNEFNEEEKKIYEILFEGKENELSEKVNFISNAISRENIPDKKFLSKEEFVNNYLKENRKGQVMFMNPKKYIILAAAALIAIAVTITIFQSGNEEKSVVVSKVKNLNAKVTFVAGDVKVKSNINAQSFIPKVGALLNSSHIIITGDKASVDVSFSNSSAVRIKQNSELAIKTLVESDGKVVEELSLKKGMMLANVNKKKQSDEFKVYTPTIIAGVRGTRFMVEVKPGKESEFLSRVVVSEGTVALYNQKDQKALSEEPVEIIEAKEQDAEIKRIGDKGVFEKSKISQSDENELNNMDKQIIEEKIDSETALFKKYGRLELLTLEDKSTVTGVITSMDEDHFTVHTVNGIITIPKGKVVSTDNKR